MNFEMKFVMKIRIKFYTSAGGTKERLSTDLFLAKGPSHSQAEQHPHRHKQTKKANERTQETNKHSLHAHSDRHTHRTKKHKDTGPTGRVTRREPSTRTARGYTTDDSSQILAQGTNSQESTGTKSFLNCAQLGQTRLLSFEN